MQVRKWLISGEINYNVCRICSLTLLPPEVLIPTPITLSVSSAFVSCVLLDAHWRCSYTCPCTDSQPPGLLQRPDNQLTRLQCVMRAAARLVIRAPSRAPVSVAMRDVLHWLSFPQYVTFKLCLLTYKCLHGLAPEYLSRCCVPLTAVPGRPRLRSADDRQTIDPA